MSASMFYLALSSFKYYMSFEMLQRQDIWVCQVRKLISSEDTNIVQHTSIIMAYVM